MSGHDLPSPIKADSQTADLFTSIENDLQRALKEFSTFLAVLDVTHRQYMARAIAFIVKSVAELKASSDKRRLLIEDEFWGPNRPNPTNLPLVVARRLFQAKQTTNYRYNRARRFARVAQRLIDEGVEPNDAFAACDGKTLQQLSGDFSDPETAGPDTKATVGLSGRAHNSAGLDERVVGGVPRDGQRTVEGGGWDDDAGDDTSDGDDLGDDDLGKVEAPRPKPVNSPGRGQVVSKRKRFSFSEQRHVALEFNGHGSQMWALDEEKEFDLRGKRLSDGKYGERHFQIVSVRREPVSPGRWFVNLDHDVAFDLGQLLSLVREGKRETQFYFQRRTKESGIVLLDLKLVVTK